MDFLRQELYKDVLHRFTLYYIDTYFWHTKSVSLTFSFMAILCVRKKSSSREKNNGFNNKLDIQNTLQGRKTKMKDNYDE